jgi:hypothetical protein
MDGTATALPAPSPDAITQATVFVEETAKSENAPSRLAPSVVGGVGVTFKRENLKVYVEFRNTGTVHALFSDGIGEPIVEKIQMTRVAYADLMARIKKYLYE